MMAEASSLFFDIFYISLTCLFSTSMSPPKGPTDGVDLTNEDSGPAVSMKVNTEKAENEMKETVVESNGTNETEKPKVADKNIKNPSTLPIVSQGKVVSIKVNTEEAETKMEEPSVKRNGTKTVDKNSKNPSTLPIVSLREGLQLKVSAWELQSWVSMALTLDGRDKITKFLQYVARLLAWWLAGTTQAQRFTSLKTSITTSRKAFRLGRTLIEYQKLRSAGIIERIGWNLKHNFPENEGESDDKPPVTSAQRSFFRRASSNIGWGPVNLEENEPSPSRRKFYRSISSVAYRMYRPLASRLSATGESSLPPDDPLWKVVGSALKMLGLFGFWTGDNISFLTSSGLFDNFKVDKPTRMAQRKQLATKASLAANKFYFAGGIAGLYVSLRAYLEWRKEKLQTLQDRIDAAEDEDEELEAKRAFDKAKAKQFILFLAVLKSSCDVLAFTNNPGIDLWQKHYGRKMHEGLHCLCGLISASTVMYNFFPNASNEPS
jgi:hypothetical protein